MKPGSLWGCCFLANCNNSSRNMNMLAEIPARDVYNGLKTALDVLTIVAMLTPIPHLDGVVSAVKGIMDTVEVR